MNRSASLKLCYAILLDSSLRQGNFLGVSNIIILWTISQSHPAAPDRQAQCEPDEEHTMSMNGLV